MQSKLQFDLIQLRDEKLAAFNARLVPTVAPDTVLGISTPKLRKYARTIEDFAAFLDTLPHMYFEENQLHAILLSGIRDFDACVAATDAFLPYIDNWATCDQLVPKIFAKNITELLPWIHKWISARHNFTVRFAIGCLMRFYLGDNLRPEYIDMVINVRAGDYYIDMMRAWYFATALAKNWDDVVPILRDGRLDRWTHNKTIQKAIESYRITPEYKETLRHLHRKV